MLSFIFVHLAWIIVLVKRLLTYLYIWQKKEYRVDKLVDYINTPESKTFFADRFTQTYFIILSIFFGLYLSFTYNVVDKSLLLTLGFLFLFITQIVFWVDAIITTYKLLKKKLLIPKFTKKMKIISTFSLIIFVGIIYFNSVQPFALTIIYQLFSLFGIPLIILMVNLLIKPLERYQKQQIINKAKEKRKSLTSMQVIAISGSYGKTTTKDILYELLKKKFNVVKTQKNQNTTISVAHQLINLDPSTEVFIAEIGAYKKGDGVDTCIFLDPTLSVITGLNNQHLSLFGNEENIKKAESESLFFLPKGAKAYINHSSHLCREITVPTGIKLIKYGINDNSYDIYAKNIVVNNLKTQFDLYFHGTPAPLTTNLLSNGNIENLVGAIAVARDLGVSTKEIQETIRDLPSTPATLEIVPKDWGNLINDSYNANINGVINAITLLSQFDGKKILVLDDILELGYQSLETHKNLAYTLSKTDINLIILVGRNFATIIERILKSEGYQGEFIVYEKNTVKSIELIKNSLRTQTSILLEGYRSRIIMKEI